MIYTVRVANGRRDDVVAALAAAGIETRVYFPPAHRQPVFADRPATELPVTEQAATEIVSLPSHTRLTAADRIEIADVIASALA